MEQPVCQSSYVPEHNREVVVVRGVAAEHIVVVPLPDKHKHTLISFARTNKKFSGEHWLYRLTIDIKINWQYIKKIRSE